MASQAKGSNDSSTPYVKFGDEVDGSIGGKTLTILVVGTGGSGKSALANTLLAKPLCPTATGQASVTQRPERRRLTLGKDDEPQLTVEIIDCPGFSGRKKTDDKVKQQLKDIESFDVLACCFDISSSGGRYRSTEHFQTLITLREIFGEECMKEKCIIVLTKGNLLFDHELRYQKSAKVSDVVRDWKEEHEEEVREQGEEAEAFLRIPVFVAGHATFDENGVLKSRSKIDGSEEWYEELWSRIAERSGTDQSLIYIDLGVGTKEKISSGDSRCYACCLQFLTRLKDVLIACFCCCKCFCTE